MTSAMKIATAVIKVARINILGLGSILFMLAGAIIYLAARWDDFKRAFAIKGIMGPLQIMLADFISFVIKVQEWIQKIPGVGTKIISEADVKMTREFRDKLLAEVGAKPLFEERPKREAGTAGESFGKIMRNMQREISAIPLSFEGAVPPRRAIEEILPQPRPRVPMREERMDTQPTSETIELIVNLDGDVLARAMAERDRRTGLRQVQ
jgi:hypothetical protein